jgi:hypothetical protein
LNFSEERVVFARTLWYIALFGPSMVEGFINYKQFGRNKTKGQEQT